MHQTVEKTKKKMVIRIERVAIGHVPHSQGCGVQKDRRTRRNRTRAAQKQRVIREWE